MKGLSVLNGNVEIENKELKLVSDSELLIQELRTFLNIRCAHIVDNKIIDNGECFWDQGFGIDYILIFESDNDNLIINHIKNKIMQFFNDRINRITEFNLTRDREKRDLSIDFKFISIYGRGEYIAS